MRIIKSITLWVIISLLFLTNPINSYEIDAAYKGKTISPKIIKIEWVEGYHTVVDNNLNINIKAGVMIKRDILNYSDHFNITFNPREWARSPPVKNIRYSVSDDKESIIGILNEDGKIKEARSWHDITVHVSPSDFDYYDHKRYTVELNYVLENHVFKQGEFYVVGLNFPNMHNNMNDAQLVNYLELPYPTSIPYRFPEGVDSYRVGSYDAEGRWRNERWVFRFTGSDKKTFWYFDANEAKKKNILLVTLGILLGGFLSLFNVSGRNRRQKILIACGLLILIVAVGYLWYK